jgi:hypothetical protein
MGSEPSWLLHLSRDHLLFCPMHSQSAPTGLRSVLIQFNHPQILRVQFLSDRLYIALGHCRHVSSSLAAAVCCQLQFQYLRIFLAERPRAILLIQDFGLLKRERQNDRHHGALVERRCQNESADTVLSSFFPPSNLIVAAAHLASCDQGARTNYNFANGEMVPFFTRLTT